MKKGLIVLTLLLCFAAFTVTLAETVTAQTPVIPGVKIGDIFWYTTYSNWQSSNPYDSIPTDLQTVNQTISMEVIMSDVNDTYVRTFSATYYLNENPNAGRGTVNIQTGEVTDAGFPAIIGGNLVAGQIIHPFGSDGIYINNTIALPSNNNRPTNQISISVTNATSGLTSSSDRYFDQATGILVQETESTIDSGTVSGYTGTTQVTMVLKSSPWDPQTVPTPEFPPIIALPIFIGATTLILIALKKKHMIAGNPAVKA